MFLAIVLLTYPFVAIWAYKTDRIKLLRWLTLLMVAFAYVIVSGK